MRRGGKRGNHGNLRCNTSWWARAHNVRNSSKATCRIMQQETQGQTPHTCTLVSQGRLCRHVLGLSDTIKTRRLWKFASYGRKRSRAGAEIRKDTPTWAFGGGVWCHGRLGYQVCMLQHGLVWGYQWRRRARWGAARHSPLTRALPSWAELGRGRASGAPVDTNCCLCINDAL